MSFRIIALVAATVPGLLAAQGFEYTPSTSQYRITQKAKVSQEAMGQKQEAETGSYQLVTVTVARAGRDTISLAAVIDSVTQTGPMGPTPGLEKLVGMRADATLSPTGAFYTAWVKDSTITGATNITDALSRFLPRIKGRLAPGSAWVDTTTAKVKQGTIEMDRKMVSRYRVDGDTTIAGAKAWKLTREDSTALTGSGTAQGQPLTMEGSGTAKGALYVSDRGVFLGGAGDEQSTVKLVLTGNGLEVMIVQSANSKIEKTK